MKEILSALLILAGSGLVLGFLLSVASKVFAVEKDELAEAITDLLPGANCGACGYMGCADYAVKMAKGEETNPTKCAAVTQENFSLLCKLLGREDVRIEKRVAKVLCSGGKEHCKESFVYDGAPNCIEAANVIGGPRECVYGCLGFGACVQACKWDAIHLTDNGLAQVDASKCTGCGACVRTCPKHIIALVPASAPVFVQCSSLDFGKDVLSICQKGCIGCKACLRACSQGAIAFKPEENLPVIDYEKCIGCMACVEKCPRKVIHTLHR